MIPNDHNTVKHSIQRQSSLYWQFDVHENSLKRWQLIRSYARTVLFDTSSNKSFGYLWESPHRGDSNNYLKTYVLWRNKNQTWYLLHIILLIKNSLHQKIHFITKTRLFKYMENFTSKKLKFSDKKLWYFSYFCSKHRLWVLVRTASARRF